MKKRKKNSVKRVAAQERMAKARQHKFNKRMVRDVLTRKKANLELQQSKIKEEIKALKHVISTM